MLPREERLGLARSLCERVAARHPGDVLAAGLYGSTAAERDTPWSDLELLFIVRDSSVVEPRQFWYREVCLNLVVVRQGALEKDLTGSPLAWEYWMTLLHQLRVLLGSAERVEAWRALGRSVPEARFREALEASLPWLIVEALGRVLSCRERGAHEDVPWAVMKLLLEVKVVLCLLNRRWVMHHHFEAVADTFAFPKRPEGYEALARALRASRDAGEAAALARRLADGLWDLLEREGVAKPRQYQDPAELPL